MAIGPDATAGVSRVTPVEHGGCTRPDIASVGVSMTAPRHHLRLLWWAVTIFGAILALSAPTASAADNPLETSTPPNGTTLDRSPNVIQLSFRDRLGADPKVAMACNGTSVETGAASVGEDLKSLSFNLAVTLSPGSECTVSWTVNNEDGSSGGSGRIQFTLAGTPAGTATTNPPAASTGASSGGTSLNGPLAMSRLIANIGLAALFGALALIVLTWPEGVEYVLTVRFLRAATIIATVGALLTVVVMSGIIHGGSLSDGFSPGGWSDLTDVTGGTAALLRLALCIGCFWTVARPDRVNDPNQQTIALAIPGLAVATLAFTRGTEAGLIGVLAGLVHVIGMSVWFGGLALLARVVLSGPGEEDLVHAVRGFRRISALAILATAVSGVALAYQLDWGHLFDTGHGRVVLLKTVAVAGMVFVGLAAREFIRSKLSRVDEMTARLSSRLQRAVSIEALAGVGVLALTAWATSLGPAGIAEGPRVVPDLGPSHTVVNEAEGFQATVRLTEQLGANAVFIDIDSPREGLQDVQIKFTPPPGSTGTGVILHVPLKGAGQAVLSKDKNLQLNVPGTWTVIVTVNEVLMNSFTVNIEAGSQVTTATPT